MDSIPLIWFPEIEIPTVADKSDAPSHLPQQPQLCQQRGVLLRLLRGGLGGLLVLQTETVNLLQDLSREDRRKEDGHTGLHGSLSLFLLEAVTPVVRPLPVLL